MLEFSIACFQKKRIPVSCNAANRAPKFDKKKAETQSFQDCVFEKSIRCESVSADLDVMSESAILWMASVDWVNGPYLSGARKMCRTLQIRKIGVQVIIKLGNFLYSKNCNELYLSRIHV